MDIKHASAGNEEVRIEERQDLSMADKYRWIEWFFFTQVLCQYCNLAFYNLYNNGAIAIITAWIIFYFSLFSFCTM
jgi:hypothetical protein